MCGYIYTQALLTFPLLLSEAEAAFPFKMSLSRCVQVLVDLARAANDKDDRVKNIVRENIQKLSRKEKNELQDGYCEGFTFISNAARWGQQFLMEILVVDCNLDPKKPDLHYAACGQTEMVMTLVETYDCPL
ncbi:hypothetical protein PVAP13_7KG076009 [Panicum virgatum]|uniref:Uncharacterized protein n=1 Tax=Panicum virgatum TaxID=38727 RepID=A0A8T0QI20_PANVG|nr:hypothetical protein PVAP13_7KG076009 [Panicum virgatum]